MEAEAAATRCYRHPSYETYVRCTRCDRYICPDCMREAAVGHHCVECVKEGQRSVRQARSLFGGAVPRAAAPVVTYTLMLLNVLAYVVEIVRPDVVDRFGVLGAALVDRVNGDYYAYESGVFPGFELTGVADGEWYRLLTGAFLHLPPGASFGVMHLVFNMFALWNLGRVVEGQLGRARYLALYLFAAVGGSVLVYLVSPLDTAVGASGAIFGLAASFYVINRRLGRDMGPVNRFLAGFLLWMVISAAFTSWEGHLGGLLAGGLVTYGLAYAPAKLRTSAAQLAGGAVLVVLLAVVVLVRTAALTGSA
ncbi:rhomboid family intramembrane serine protease [Streptomyces nitrosporeus]|uniref:Rhomboid family intramembrane serine protease n=1 Tax=Streptomyces nitrosporeus TaxID=28894 RepID=A0A5J6FJ71_9ACTN|nr:rhomboid family intramembrane serine protease [Streptomyces nitrosporeus]QEU74980.1 rhomboid family intramembrane serine protease [Streptomyces nitrosporeus]GGY92002.1 rhomboid family intramembrane serine protease [Streptomyces nitrosporeus]